MGDTAKPSNTTVAEALQLLNEKNENHMADVWSRISQTRNKERKTLKYKRVSLQLSCWTFHFFFVSFFFILISSKDLELSS